MLDSRHQAGGNAGEIQSRYQITPRGGVMRIFLLGFLFGLFVIFSSGLAAEVPPADHAYGTWNTLSVGFNNAVNVAVDYNGDLVVGGAFTQLGDMSANSVARWDGTEWHAMGSGLHAEVLAMEVYDGQLIAGVQPHYWGVYSYPPPDTTTWIARWDGSNWLDLNFPDTTPGDFHDFLVWNGKLVVAGMFELADGAPSNHVAAWNGTSWEALGGGLQDTYRGMVWSLAEYQGDLYALGGSMVTAAGDTVKGISRFDGVNWQPVGSGLSRVSYTDEGERLGVFNGKLVVGSSRLDTAGGIAVNYMAAWDGASWTPFGNQAGTFLDLTTMEIIDNRVIWGEYNWISWSNGGELHRASFPDPGSAPIYPIVYDLYVWDTVVVWSGIFSSEEPFGAVLWKPLSEFVCCQDFTGNVNGSADDVTDISDLTMLVNHLFVTYDPLPCPAEANTAGGEWFEGPIDISDLTRMVNHLFVTFENTDYCR